MVCLDFLSFLTRFLPRLFERPDQKNLKQYSASVFSSALVSSLVLRAANGSLVENIKQFARSREARAARSLEKLLNVLESGLQVVDLLLEVVI